MKKKYLKLDKAESLEDKLDLMDFAEEIATIELQALRNKQKNGEPLSSEDIASLATLAKVLTLTFKETRLFSESVDYTLRNTSRADIMQVIKAPASPKKEEDKS